MHPSSYGSTQDVTRNACSSNPSRPDATTLVAQRNNIIEHLQGALLPPKARYRLFPNQASPGDRVSRHLLLKYNVAKYKYDLAKLRKHSADVPAQIVL